MSGIRFTADEDALILRLGDQARLGDIGAALNRSADSIQKRRKRLHAQAHNRTGKPLASSAVKEARRLQQKGQAIPALKHWTEAHGRRMANHWREWSTGDERLLSELIGAKSLAEIADELRRSRGAVIRKARKLGIFHRAYEHRAAEVARRLGIDSSTIRGYCTEGKLTSWREGAWIIVQREEAEWLIHNWRFAETDWVSLNYYREAGYEYDCDDI